jgi:hypothetical protein
LFPLPVKRPKRLAFPLKVLNFAPASQGCQEKIHNILGHDIKSQQGIVAQRLRVKVKL